MSTPTVDQVGGLRRYGMAIIMVVVAGAQAVIAGATGGFATDEKLQIAVTIAGAVVVYIVPNVPQWPWAKTGVGAVIVGLNLAQQLLAGGITPEEWLMIGVAVLGALGLLVNPNVLSTSSVSVPAGQRRG